MGKHHRDGQGQSKEVEAVTPRQERLADGQPTGHLAGISAFSVRSPHVPVAHRPEVRSLTFPFSSSTVKLARVARRGSARRRGMSKVYAPSALPVSWEPPRRCRLTTVVDGGGRRTDLILRWPGGRA